MVTATLDFIKFAWDHPMIYCIFLVSEKNYLSMFYIQSLSCYCGNIEFQIDKKKHKFLEGHIRLGLWCLMPLSTIFQLQMYIVVVSFIGGGNQSTQGKPPTCRNITDKFYHIMLYREHLVMCGIWTHNFSSERH